MLNVESAESLETERKEREGERVVRGRERVVMRKVMHGYTARGTYP